MRGTEGSIPMPAEIAKKNRAKKNLRKETVSNNTFVSSRIFVSFLSLSVILLFFIAILLSVLVLSFKNEEKKFFNTYKSIIVTTQPADAGVYINNLYVGISPLALDNINLNALPVLKIRKEGYKEYKTDLNIENTKETINVVLEPATLDTNSTLLNTNANVITWSDYGLTVKGDSTMSESLSLEKASCKEVKSYLVDATRCPNDATVLNYNAKVLTFTQNNNKINMTVKLPTNADNCSLTPSKCNSKNVKKLETFKFLNQDVDVYEAINGDKITTFLQPVIKGSGKEYNSFYIEFNNRVDYKNVLSMVLKNA